MNEELDFLSGALGWQITRLGWDYEDNLSVLPVNLARWFTYLHAEQGANCIELVFKSSGAPLYIRLRINAKKIPHSKKEILDYLEYKREELQEHFKELKYKKLGQMVAINQHQ